MSHVGDGRVRIRSRKTAGRIEKISPEPVAPTNMCQPLLNADGAQWPVLAKGGSKRDKETLVISKEAQSFMIETQRGRRIHMQQRAA